jgi:predicted nucleotidyltransferase
VAALLGEVPITVVGGAALAFHGHLKRPTFDTDVAVPLRAAEIRRRLLAAGEWDANADDPVGYVHRATKAALDVLPTPAEALACGAVRVSNGVTMDLTGLERVHEQAVAIAGLPANVGMTPAACLPVQKMVAFLDRPAERRKDLHDLARLLEHYVEWGDPRLFQDNVYDAELEGDQPVAFVLGLDAGRLATETGRGRVDLFLQRVSDPRRDGILSELTRQLPYRDSAGGLDLDRGLGLLRAFYEGFRST